LAASKHGEAGFIKRELEDLEVAGREFELLKRDSGLKKYIQLESHRFRGRSGDSQPEDICPHPKH